jgi:hypothetical protein
VLLLLLLVVVVVVVVVAVAVAVAATTCVNSRSNIFPFQQVLLCKEH